MDRKRQKVADEQAPPQEQAGCEALQKWMLQNGGTWGPLKISSEPGIGRGLYAAEDLEAGAELFTLPDQLILTTAVALGSPIGKVLTSKCNIVRSCAVDIVCTEADDKAADDSAAPNTGPALGTGPAQEAEAAQPELAERSVLYAYLVHARRHSESDFTAYASTLPDSFSMPFSWEPEQLGWLPEPTEDLDHEGVDLVSELGRMGEHLHNQLALVDDALDGTGLLDGVSMEEWLWAHQSYSSRCFPRSCLAVDSQAVADDADGVLVPVLDMVNSIEQGSQLTFHGGRATVHCAVKKGSQIYSRYGVKPNRTLLACYGYCRWNNPAEKLPLWVSALRKLNRDPAAAETNAAQLSAFQQRFGEGIAGTLIELSVAEPLPEALVEAAALCCGDDALAYIQELVAETEEQLLGDDDADKVERLAAQMQEGSGSIHVLEGNVKLSYAFTPEACVVAYRQSQLGVLQATKTALATKSNK